MNDLVDRTVPLNGVMDGHLQDGISRWSLIDRIIDALPSIFFINHFLHLEVLKDRIRTVNCEDNK